MSYYKIIPNGSYEVIRKCPGCGNKTNYVNTNHFRVNANGNLVDVWLIYQCEKCKHTLNLAIYERVSPGMISKDEYERFLGNDYDLSRSYGRMKELFVKNKAEIALEALDYEIREIDNRDISKVHIENSYGIKVRIDKVLSNILPLTRSQIRKQIKDGTITVQKDYEGITVLL